ncbi:hypothetical protein MMC07_003667 [Pseudocyphellaria aurata]|nr:hypothetical protein [Pseudocyphellaria aurata]
MNGQIPPNDPEHPRWLLDTQDWRIRRYMDIVDDVSQEGYGIVSYTWGYIAYLDFPQKNTPEGLLWDVPTTETFTLQEARAIMSNIGSRYVWWDWMCVPQNVRGGSRPITPELQQVKNQEISKQMHIYRNAKTSIIWLHTTYWGQPSALKSLLRGQINAADPEDSIDQTLSLLDSALSAERWLGSGWTLQEGVLLSETVLKDHTGFTLQDDRFIHYGRASVIDLTARITFLSISIAEAFVLQADGASQKSAIGERIASSPEKAEKYRGVLTTLLRSGLVSYAKHSPLYILAGKEKRYYSMEHDKCWALLGALDLEGVDVSYQVDMNEVRRRFLEALVRRYQWALLLVPRLASEDWGKELDWLDFADGRLLPLGTFIDSEINAGKPSKDLPRLSFDKKIIVDGLKNGIDYYDLTSSQISWYRRYRQTSSGVHIDTPRSGKSSPKESFDAAYLPLESLGPRDSLRGMRCIRINDFKLQGNSAEGKFGGCIDIWIVDVKIKKVGKVTLLAH